MRYSLIFLLLVSPICLGAQEDLQLGVHGGVGTDINLGLGLGVKVSAIPFQYRNQPLEIGVEVFYSNTTEITDEGLHSYEENTQLLVIGLLGNLLYRYNKEKPGVFYILGLGVAGVSVEWEEKSETDSSLGTPYGSSGSMQSADGTTGGSILNVGVGYHLGNGFEVRLELPVFVVFTAPGQASAVAPNLTLMAGYRF